VRRSPRASPGLSVRVPRSEQRGPVACRARPATCGGVLLANPAPENDLRSSAILRLVRDPKVRQHRFRVRRRSCDGPPCPGASYPRGWTHSSVFKRICVGPRGESLASARVRDDHQPPRLPPAPPARSKPLERSLIPLRPLSPRDAASLLGRTCACTCPSAAWRSRPPSPRAPLGPRPRLDPRLLRAQFTDAPRVCEPVRWVVRAACRRRALWPRRALSRTPRCTKKAAGTDHRGARRLRRDSPLARRRSHRVCSRPVGIHGRGTDPPGQRGRVAGCVAGRVARLWRPCDALWAGATRRPVPVPPSFAAGPPRRGAGSTRPRGDEISALGDVRPGAREAPPLTAPRSNGSVQVARGGVGRLSARSTVVRRPDGYDPQPGARWPTQEPERGWC
jgi:hypothetical protein